MGVTFSRTCCGDEGDGTDSFVTDEFIRTSPNIYQATPNARSSSVGGRSVAFSVESIGSEDERSMREIRRKSEEARERATVDIVHGPNGSPHLNLLRRTISHKLRLDSQGGSSMSSFSSYGSEVSCGRYRNANLQVSDDVASLAANEFVVCPKFEAVQVCSEDKPTTPDARKPGALTRALADSLSIPPLDQSDDEGESLLKKGGVVFKQRSYSEEGRIPRHQKSKKKRRRKSELKFRGGVDGGSRTISSSPLICEYNAL